MLQTYAGLDLVERLRDFGDAPALQTATELLSYSELNDRVDQVAYRLGTTRRLVLVEAANTVDAVVGYLGALRGQHPVILADASRPQLLAELRGRFDPDVAIGSQGWDERRVGTRHELHADLALLLSTSGSTGSPKLVRLSHRNLQSNADAIGEYLKLSANDRAITSLPLGYCYGLSVLNSHLAVGASVVLTECSVLDADFWKLFHRSQATSFAAVPHTFSLLDRIDVPWFAAPHLRYVTQAGGRLDAGQVRRIDALGRANGWQLFVMYGQTEATARIAYLPPSEISTHAHCIGRPIPGASLRIDSAGPDGTGELVYTGPNVMMGYASDPSALADGPDQSELRTGDLARETDSGLFEIVGRMSRFAKLLGHRVDLDRVQASLAAQWPSVVCTSDDRHLIVAASCTDPAQVRRHAARLTGLPPGLVVVRQYAEVPRLSNGKPDYETIKTAGAAAPDIRLDPVTALQAAYAEVLGFDRVDDSATFVQLGGDSLSFVEMTVHLEEQLAKVPANWPVLPIRDLAALGKSTSREKATPPPPDPKPGASVREPVAETPPRPARTTAWIRLDTSVVLRAVAIALVVLVHLEIWSVRGGAHLLLGVAGYTFARFPLAAVRLTDRISGLAASIARLAVPSMLFIAALVVLSDGYSVANVFMLNHYLGPSEWTEEWNFWFVEAMVEILLFALLLLAVPGVRRFERRHQLLLPGLVLAAGLLVRYNAFGWSDIPLRYGRPHTVVWIFALGWLIHNASTPVQRVLLSAVVLITFADYFPDEPVRVAVVQAGLLLLIWFPYLPTPRAVAPLLRRLAAASLWIYLTHWVVWPFLLDELQLPRAAIVVCCLVGGVGAAAAVAGMQQAVINWARAFWGWIQARGLQTSGPQPVAKPSAKVA